MNYTRKEQLLSSKANNAKLAVSRLKELKKGYMQGLLKYETVQEVGKAYVDIFNDYSKALAKERQMPYKPISLGYFLR